MPDNDLSEAIANNAAGPKSATQDGTSATAHSLADQIAADRYLASKRALKRGPHGVRSTFGRFKPPGAVG